MNKKGIAVGGFGAERRESQRLICAISFCFFLFFFSNQVAYFWGQRPGWMASLFFWIFEFEKTPSTRCVVWLLARSGKRNKIKQKSRPSHDLFYMCRVLPKAPTPACDAPLLNPACSPMCPSWARNCSSLNSRSFLSAILGPRRGPLYSGCFCVCKKIFKN